MSWQHLRAFVWLRWRLMANGWRRGGQINFIITVFFAACAVAASLPLFAGSLWLGMRLFANQTPEHLLYTWDVLVVGFTFIWSIGLITELQRTESLALSKFLHFPVSIQGAYVLNYLSSLVSLTTILFAPVMLGLALGLVFSKGPLLLLTLPLLLAFLLMVTAISYQLQGWLASLMTNPRRRRAVVVGITAAFVLVAQLPNLLNMFGAWQPDRQRLKAFVREQEALKQEYDSGKIDGQAYAHRMEEANKRHQQETNQRMATMAGKWQRTVGLLNWVVPIGWLPLGVRYAAEGSVLMPVAALVLLTAIGSGSLWRGYRTTMRLYQGAYTARKPRAAPRAAVRPAAAAEISGKGLLELRLPGFSEPVSAIAMACFRSLLRSPEAKMMLLTPLLMTVIAGGVIVRQQDAVPAQLRPILAIGVMLTALFGMMHLMANQFGFDREGFRVLVLCSAARRDILLGKNLAFLPVAAAIVGFLVGALEVVCPMRFDRFLAMVPQFMSMYLLFSALMNMLSIYTPIYLAAGSLKPANPRLLTVLIQILSFTIFFPLTQLPTLLPLGLEMLSEQLGWTQRAPIFLLLATAECAAVIFIYACLLRWQGGLLQGREQRILDVVTKPAA